MAIIEIGTKVVCGFPGIGKSYIFNHQDELGIKVSDSDSSKFSHAVTESGERVKNPDFPANYIEHIKSLIDDESIDYVLVSTHSVVRDALADANIPFTIVYPDPHLKDVYIDRYIKRGSPEALVKVLSENFEKFADECADDLRAEARIAFIHSDETLASLIPGD